MKKQGLIYALITALMFATLEPVSKLIANEIYPYSMTFIRFIIGSAILMPFALYDKKKYGVALKWQDHLRFLGLGVLFVCVSMVMLQMAILQSSSPALIAIIFSSNSVITIAMASVMLKERLSVQKVAALVLCVLGIAVCSWRNFMQRVEIMPVIVAILAAFTFSLYTVMSKKVMKKIQGSVVTGFSFFYGSLALLVFLLASGKSAISGISAGNIGILLFLGIFVTGIGYWAYFMALDKANATTASLAFFIKPILAPFAAFLINGTPFSAEVFIALVLVLTGSYLSSK